MSVPTMQMIATRAGVSRMTVSRALRDDPSISLATRERIKALAMDMGYRTNALVSALMTQLRHQKPATDLTTIAFVTTHSTREGWQTRGGEMASNYFAGAAERTAHLGYRLEEVWGRQPGMTGKRLSQVLYARGIRGILLAPMPHGRGHFTMDWSLFSLAAIGYSMWRPNLHRAVMNAAQILGDSLRRTRRQHGYRRIGLMVDNNINERNNHAYTMAFLDFQREIPKTEQLPFFMYSKWNENAFLRWVENERPDVIFFSGSFIPGLLRSKGFRIPEDIGLVQLFVPAKSEGSGIFYDGRLAGAAAVDLIVEQLQRNETGIPPHPKIVMLQGSWVEGNTLRKQTKTLEASLKKKKIRTR